MNGFVLYMDPGVDQVDVAMLPRDHQRERRWFILVDFLPRKCLP
jgi:hypothetical protein